jgi:hypothetical protein
MPTHDYIIANGTGAAVRADINLALSAIVSLNSSASEPGTMYAYQLWADTGSNPSLLKIRNGANSGWITLRQLDGDFSIVAVEDGLQATPSLTFTNDLNTGVFRSGTDALAIVTGGQYAIACTSTQAVGIKTANPSTALHVAGNARVGADDVTDAHLQIGKGATGNRNSYIDIVADTTYTDYGLRVIRNNTGANATSELKHRGTGALNFTTEEAAPIVFNTTNSPRATIDTSGRLLVGTSTATNNVRLDQKIAAVAGPTAPGGISLTSYAGASAGNRPILDIQKSRGSTDGSMTLVASGDLVGSINFRGADGSGFVSAAVIDAYVDGTPGANDMPGRLVFSTTADGGSSPTERMRIDSTGVVTIGQGAWTPNTGYFQLTPKITSGTGSYYFYDNSDGFFPFPDNTQKLGNPSYRWTTVYATTALINTSDANTKQQIRTLSDAEKAVAQSIKGLIRAYKFNDSVAEKGDGARIHVGVIAQDVQAAFVAEGLDASKYSLFCSDTWYEVDGEARSEDEGFYTKDTPNAIQVSRLGIRYDELLAFVLAVL